MSTPAKKRRRTRMENMQRDDWAAFGQLMYLVLNYKQIAQEMHETNEALFRMLRAATGKEPPESAAHDEEARG